MPKDLISLPTTTINTTIILTTTTITPSNSTIALPSSNSITGLPNSHSNTGLPNSNLITGLTNNHSNTGLTNSHSSTGLTSSNSITGLPSSNLNTNLVSSNLNTSLAISITLNASRSSTSNRSVNKTTRSGPTVATVPMPVEKEGFTILAEEPLLIRFMFQEHGNVVEVIQPKDKKTGERHGYCFVKYAMFEEAERAIAALNNRYMFPGESTTIKVRYADAERDRPGPLPDKLYVGCLNKQASKREIEEIFSHYGHVLDVFIMRDEHREHRGCGFVQFSQRDMAQAAIRGLSGIFTMKGCDQPLIVRSANPKRPRNGEPRGNYAFNSMPSGPHPQELAMRSMQNLGDSMAGHIPPNASYPGQHISTNPQPQGVSHWANPQVAACHVTYQSYPPVQQAHSQPTSLPSQQTQTLQGSSQSSHPADSEQKQQPLIPPASQVPSQQNGNVPKLESPQTGSSQPIAATSVVPIVPQSLETVALQESDWSEHTCPEGNKYYYNCVTCESRWNKPEEFALFEKLLQKQQKVQNPSQHIQPDSTGPSVKQVSQSQEGMGHMEIKSETSPVVDLTCV
ncbi:flowering time control protein FCA isoform X5 [Gossypium hirsutum]|uniref:Flowering time control protein FCA isoform X5 n=1 Tax=Gossypium hirsutum TaxID=3635 RepID=A0ABM3ACK3_GOSHI|nr:flowering time control protein FCA-like isoform X5 [Gossypium hirsutum]XP_040952595.1 flowering time control protein FCA-like isoform X5 [Gossypium hirsutum]